MVNYKILFVTQFIFNITPKNERIDRVPKFIVVMPWFDPREYHKLSKRVRGSD